MVTELVQLRGDVVGVGKRISRWPERLTVVLKQVKQVSERVRLCAHLQDQRR